MSSIKSPVPFRPVALRPSSKRAPKRWRKGRASYLQGMDASLLLSLESSALLGDVGPKNSALQEVLGDALVQGALQSRLGAVGRRSLLVESPPGETSEEETISVCRRALLSLSFSDGSEDGARFGIRSAVQSLALASVFGCSALWVEWREDAETGLVFPGCLSLFDPAAYRWGTSGGAPRLLIRTEEHPEGASLSALSETPDLHFVVARPSSSSSRPELGGVGFGLLRACFIGRMAEVFLAGYAESFSIPSLVVERPQGTPYSAEELDRLEELFAQWMSDQRVSLPPGCKASLLTPGTGGADLFRFVFDRVRSLIDVSLLGQDGTGNGAGGSLAKAEVNERTRADIIDSDCYMVGDALSGLIAKICAINRLPGIPPVVRFGAPPEVQAEKTREKIRAAREFGLALDPVKVAAALDVTDLLVS